MDNITAVGIDPGWSGGIALVRGHNAGQAYAFSGATEKDILDNARELLAVADVCYIEKVHAMPKQGVTSMFKFGHIYGFLRAIVMTSNIPMYEVAPQTWQRSLGCLSKGDKNVTKARAQAMFPAIKITHATADALLIATYGYNQVNTIDQEMFR